MTTADKLISKGLTQGRTEGRTEGRVETLVQLLTTKFGRLPRETLDTVRSASDEKLRTWTDRVLTANTLADVLR